MSDYHHNEPHQVEMLKGVQRQSSCLFCGFVAKEIGNEAMTEFVKRDADERRDNTQQDAEKI